MGMELIAGGQRASSTSIYVNSGSKSDATEANEEEGSAPLLGRAENLLMSGKRSELIQRLERVVQIEERALRREEEDRRLDAQDSRQQAQDNRRRRVRRLPSHLRD